MVSEKDLDIDLLNQQLLNEKERLSLALEFAKICIFEVDVKKQWYTRFENAEVIFGVSGEKILREVRAFSSLPPEEYRRHLMDYFVHPEDEKIILAAFDNLFTGKSVSCEARLKTGEQDYNWCKIDVMPIQKSQDVVRIMGVISDIQPMRDQIDALEKETWLDSFTRVYTKQRFIKVCETIIKNNPRERMALILVDLDGFKSINDTFGHPAGDEVLLSVASGMKTLFSDHAVIGRFGGDEFIILLRNAFHTSFVEELLQSFLENRESQYSVTKSIGVAFHPDSAKSFEELLRHADTALYQAKRNKNCFIIYNEEAQGEPG